EMVAAKVPPRAIVEIMDNTGANMIVMDVSNLNRLRFAGLDTAGCQDMCGFIVYLEANGYECMQLGRRFNEVVVVDATYKTNQFRLPFVNMIGVHNVGPDDKTLSNFVIAGAWVAKEDEVSYSWVMEQLSNAVYLNGKWKPALYFTSVEEYGKAESLFKKMCLTGTQDGFDCAYDSLVDLTLKTTNDKGAAIKASLNRICGITEPE
ncbi:hypothetical protein, partial, partial [Absidia glauca]